MFAVVNGEIKEKLVKLLANIFQFDAVDLDFGIYKILNYKKKEISEFINKDLIDEIGKQLSLLSAEEQKKQQHDLENVKKQLIGLGIEDYENNPKYQEKKKQLDNIKISQELEKKIYNHIYTFFSRYYDKGDFLSKRRYGSNEKYSIPYNGEEVLLHWANNDQYYVKTTEAFESFSFRILGLRINFKIINVEEENGNIKSKEDKYFFLSSERIYEWDGDQLNIYFEYRCLSDDEKKHSKPNQDLINEDIVTMLKKTLVKETKTKSLFEEEGDKSLFAKTLYKYTRRNTSDYFIHKDLKGFLEKELDFYIKNEVVDLGDVTSLDVEQFNLYVLEVKILRTICTKIIEFLAQIENFQKKIWEKKKFILKTDYCITLDYIDEKYYQEILNNNAQLEEWNKLYSFDIKNEIKKLNGTLKGHIKVSNEIEILKQNPTLMIDTKFFDREFKLNILEDVEISDDKINGILINSESFHALNLLLEKYRGKIKCCYIDPPYNTDASAILYKNNYRHSSWISLLESRIHICKQFLRNDAIHCVAIDDLEFPYLSLILSRIFNDENHLATIAVRSNPHGRAMASGFSTNHDYAIFHGFSQNAEVGRIPREEDKLARYPEIDEKGNFTWINFQKGGVESMRSDRPKSYYPLYVKGDSVRIPEMSWSEIRKEWEDVESPKTGEEVVFPIDDKGNERVWSWGRSRSKKEAKTDLRALKTDEGWHIQRKYRVKPEGSLPGTWWHDAKYSATESGTRILKHLFGKRNTFSYPKSVFLVEDCLKAANCTPDSLVIDYMAGSGTTGHAVIKMNMKDGGKRKYILVEMGQYFDSITKPRIQKVIYSDNWDEGKPKDANGTRKHIIKYHSLEQYEDALENIEFSQKKLSEFSDYFVKYVLDFETRDSKTFLNIDKMKDPFNYKINIMEDYQQKEVTIDLIETYNYLIGLEVEKLRTFENKDDKNRRYVTIQGKKDNNQVIVIWRNIERLDAGKDRDFIQKNILKDQYDEIHINGDNLIKNAILIEEQFKTLMNGS